MDPRGLRARLTGAGCTSCGATVPVERIVVLADRGDFAFVELDCRGCGSRTMGLVLATPADADARSSTPRATPSSIRTPPRGSRRGRRWARTTCPRCIASSTGGRATSARCSDGPPRRRGSGPVT